MQSKHTNPNYHLKKKTINGLLWNTINKFLTQGLNLGIYTMLMYFLDAKDFGLITMVIAITGYSTILINFGFVDAIVQKIDIEDIHLSSVFWLNVSIGFLITLLLIFLAPEIAKFYNNKSLYLITTILSFTYILGALGSVQNAILLKKLEFKKIALVELVSIILAGGFAVWGALEGLHVWSLVILTLFTVLFNTIFLWITSNWYPSFNFSLDAIKSLFNFSINQLGNQTIGYITSNFDKLVIGKYVGDHALGIYRSAYKIMLIPLQSISSVVFKVMFSSFSKIQSDIIKIKQVYNKMVCVMGYIILPLMLGFFATCEKFILLIFGEKWIEMIPLVQIFSIVGIFVTLAAINGSVLLAIGKSNLLFKINLLTRVIIILGIILGINWGITGVAVSFLFSYPIRFLVSAYVTCKQMNLSIKVYFNQFFESILLLVLVSIIYFIFKQLFFNYIYFSNAVGLIIEIITITSFFLFFSFTLNIPAFKIVKNTYISYKDGK